VTGIGYVGLVLACGENSWSAMSLADVSLYRMGIGELPDGCSFVFAWTAV
jgi:hypothetical protein